MFKRRQPRTPLQNLKEICWPSMGWIRAFRYAKHRIVRLSDSTHKIAAGLAIGVAISFSPLLGTHFIQAGIIAYIIRANFLAALAGTFIGNPWTFPFMWWASISLGSYLFGIVGLQADAALPEAIDFSILWEITTQDPLRIFLPWLLGGYLIALLCWPLSYMLFYRMVKGAKLARTKAKIHRLHKVAQEVTGQKT